MASVFIAPDGAVRMIHSDDYAEALEELGECVTRRASDVEPDGRGGWIADLAKVQGPKLGPFRKRAEALAAEVEWLLAHNAPAPMEVAA